MKKSVLIIFAAAALASCASTDLQERLSPPTEGVDIVLKSSHIDAITRMPYIGNISEENPLSARVLATTTTSKYKTNPYANGVMIFKGDITTYEANSIEEEQGKLPATGDLYLCGLSPSDESYWGIEDENVAAITFSGKEDVMAAAEVTTSKTSVITDGKIPSLTFKHLLTKLEISLKAQAPAAPAVWGKVTKIELVKVKVGDKENFPQNRVIVKLNDATATFSGGKEFELYGMNKAGYTDETYTSQSIHSTEVKPVAYTMIAPFEAKAGDKQLTFRIYTEYTPEKNGNIVTVDLKYDGNTAGRAFGITFAFTSDENVIVGTANVIDWVNAGEVTEEV